jgi:prepilin-type processing-associated H-X9-DG protein
MSAKRSAFTLFQLLVILAVLALLFALFLPAVAKIRMAAARAQSQNNLKQIAIATHNYYDTYNAFPPGLDAKGFSAASYLLPYIEQAAVYQQIDFKKPITDEANAKIAATVIPTFLDPMDAVHEVSKDFGGTNYLFCAGSKYALKDNNGAFYLDSKVKLVDLANANGTSNTFLAGQTLKGDSMVKAMDVHRQHVQLKKDDLKNLTDDSGVKDWKDDKNIAADRCKSWMDGHFLQGTFTGTRVLNDEKPDVNCAGNGGLSGLRGVGDGSNVAMCDGSVRFITTKVKLETWKLAANATNTDPFTPDF